MGLFDKKFCDICGNKIGLLGNRKLEDGNCCKDCAKKLSPWFDERRHSTVAQIKEQLQYREGNKQSVAAFHTTRSFGENYQFLYVDEDARKFLVAGSGDFKDDNPDVVDFSQVTSVNLDVRDSRKELKQKDAEGKEISYDPPRFEYEYDFYLVIRVNHPWFDEMRFKLNLNKLVIQELGAVKRGFMITQTSFDPHMSYEYQKYEKMAGEITDILQGRCGQSMGINAGCQQTGMGGGSQQEQARELMMQAWEARKAKDQDRAIMLFKQAIQLGEIENGYAALLLSLTNKAADGTEDDCQELINWATRAKNAGYDPSEADQLIQRGQEMAHLKRITSQPDGGAAYFTAKIAEAEQQARSAEQAAGQWTCPGCGAGNTGKFCENCGSPRP